MNNTIEIFKRATFYSRQGEIDWIKREILNWKDDTSPTISLMNYLDELRERLIVLEAFNF